MKEFAQFQKMKPLLAVCFIVMVVQVNPVKPFGNNNQNTPAKNDSRDMNERISNGTEASQKEIPYYAVLLINGYLACNGALISKDTLLTAAQCIQRATNVEVILGGSLEDFYYDYEDIQIGVGSEIKIHELYNEKTHENDIGLVKLYDPVTITDYVAPITLPNTTDSYEGEQAILTGEDSNYYSSGDLISATVSIISNADCSSYFGDAVKDTNICTDGSYSGMCYYDFGAPLALDGVLVGIGSFTDMDDDLCAKPVAPTVYTRVSSYRNWILKNAGI